MFACLASTSPLTGRMTWSCRCRPRSAGRSRTIPAPRSAPSSASPAGPSQPWAPAGHVVAWDQIVLRPRPATAASGGRRRGRARAGRSTAVVDPEGGRLVELHADGVPLLVDPVELSLWRAAIDNDGLKLLGGGIPHLEGRRLPRWLALGIDRLEVGRGPRRAPAAESLDRRAGAAWRASLLRGDPIPTNRHRFDGDHVHRDRPAAARAGGPAPGRHHVLGRCGVRPGALVREGPARVLPRSPVVGHGRGLGGRHRPAALPRAPGVRPAHRVPVVRAGGPGAAASGSGWRASTACSTARPPTIATPTSTPPPTRPS